MINLIPYIQLADSIFTRFIFIPMVYILYRKFIAEGTNDRQKQGFYRQHLVSGNPGDLLLSRKNGRMWCFIPIWTQYGRPTYRNLTPAYLQYK